MLTSQRVALERSSHAMSLSIDDLLRRAVESKASDLHLKVGNHPYLRIDGLLAAITDVPRVTPEEMLSMARSEEHTSELQSPCNLVCRLLLEKKKKHHQPPQNYRLPPVLTSTPS